MTEKARPQPTEVDLICNEFIEEYAIMDPVAGSEWGYEELADKWFDASPHGLEDRAALKKEFLTNIQAAPIESPEDRITVMAVTDRVGLELQRYEMGEDHCELNNISSCIQVVRDTFSLMPSQSEEQIRAIATRLTAVPKVLQGYRLSLRHGAEFGQVAAIRQVQCGISQSEELCGGVSFFDNLVDGIIKEHPDLPTSLINYLHEGVKKAKDGYRDLSDFLRQELAPRAPQADGVGRSRYQMFSHEFVGAKVDLDESYEWAQTQLELIDQEQRKIAAELYGPGTTAMEAIERLNREPRYLIHGKANLQQWMQRTADQAIANLNGTEFDIPKPVQKIECMIDNAGTGGIFYTGPSDDFSRPGQMWWSVPEGEDTFHTWQELTTVFHEGVPGHHLQIGITTWNKALNKWRRLDCWNSGHGEGWALYAERLMEQLGYQEDLGTRFGMLDAQRLRAARVMLDIGVHLGKEIPEGGALWDAQYAWDFLKKNVAMADSFLRFELDRYLGWPGQAPSYLLGQRLWQNLRDDYLASAPQEKATLKDFHAKALPLGSLPMETLRKALLG